jgi:hypothetical protein
LALGALLGGGIVYLNASKRRHHCPPPDLRAAVEALPMSMFKANLYVVLGAEAYGESSALVEPLARYAVAVMKRGDEQGAK